MKRTLIIEVDDGEVFRKALTTFDVSTRSAEVLGRYWQDQGLTDVKIGIKTEDEDLPILADMMKKNKRK